VSIRDYDLCGCIVLAAAAIGTKQAKEAAMDLLPVARRLQGRKHVPAEVALSNHRRFSVDVLPEVSSDPILAWAKAQARKGRKFGATVESSPAAEHSNDQCICHRERIEATLQAGEMLTKDLARALGVRREVLSLSLNKLRRLGVVACRGIERGKGAGRGQKPKAWRLLKEAA
jgi:DNA-binding transcriptional ArsR family regulator